MIKTFSFDRGRTGGSGEPGHWMRRHATSMCEVNLSGGFHLIWLAQIATKPLGLAALSLTSDYSSIPITAN